MGSSVRYLDGWFSQKASAVLGSSGLLGDPCLARLLMRLAIHFSRGRGVPYQIPLNCPKDEASLWRKLRISRQQLFRLIHAGALEVDPESLVSTGFLDCTPRISNSIILGSILIFS